MLSYFLAGAAAGVFGSLSALGAGKLVLGRRQGSGALQQLATLERVVNLEQAVLPAIEAAAKESTDLLERVKQFEARATSFQAAVTAGLGQVVTREEVETALAGMITRPELELALQSAAQQILRAAQVSAPANNGNGANIRALQEQVAGISQQLGLG